MASADDGPAFGTIVMWLGMIGAIIIGAIAYSLWGSDARSAGVEECTGHMTRDGWETECEPLPQDVPQRYYDDLPEPR